MRSGQIARETRHHTRCAQFCYSLRNNAGAAFRFKLNGRISNHQLDRYHYHHLSKPRHIERAPNI